MPASATLAMFVATAMAGAFAAPLDGGAVVLYQDTTAAPAVPEGGIPAGAVELVRFPLPAVGAATVDGMIVTAAAVGPVPALATGRVGWACVFAGSGFPMLVPNVGTNDETLLVSTLDVVAGLPYTLAEWAFVVSTFQGE